MAKKPKEVLSSSDEMKRIEGYLMARGISRAMVKQIREVLVDRALQDANDISFNRVYTALGMTCVEHLNFGPKRTADFMWAFDKICDMSQKSDDPAYWSHLMEKLFEKTGLVIRTGSDDSFSEFATPEEIETFQRLAEEKAKRGLKSYKVARNY